jgi:hypothetical protein
MHPLVHLDLLNHQEIHRGLLVCQELQIHQDRQNLQGDLRDPQVHQNPHGIQQVDGIDHQILIPKNFGLQE